MSTLIQFAKGYLLNIPYIGDKIDAVDNFGEENYEGTRAWLVSTVLLILNVVTFFVLHYINSSSKNNDKFTELVYKMNIVNLMVIPFIMLSPDFHRIYMSMVLFNYVIFARWLFSSKNSTITSIVIILYMLLFDYRMMFYSETMDTVYLAVMENNLLLN